MSNRIKWISSAALALVLLIAASGFALYRYSRQMPEPVNPALAGEGSRVTLMDFAQPVPFPPLPAGWWHREFLFVNPMSVTFVMEAGVPALRCETSASGSIFGRFTDIDLARFPKLGWSWLVEVPVVANKPETIAEGDDHPARLLLEFMDADKTQHHMELIWSNGAFKPGDWKYIGDFPHFVVRGGDARTNENSGVWFSEEVNLLELYRTAFKRNDSPRLSNIAIFCDTDNTGAKSVAYFGTIDLRQ